MASQGQFKFSVDVVKGDTSGLQSIQQELTKIQKITSQDLSAQGIKVSETELKKIQSQAKELEKIFSKSYNLKLNTFDFDKLKTNLNNSKLSIAGMETSLKKLGSVGVQSISAINNTLYRTQSIMRETHPVLDKMKDTLANTVRWTIASTAINSISGAVQKAWGFTKDLDSALTDIRVVTNKSAEDMAQFARQANEAAKALGQSTKAYAEASLIYYQQGLSDSDVAARTDTTLRVANVTGQSAASVSEQLTAVWNGYKVSAEESELYIDKLAAVAASTASDLEELSTGMSKVASAASNMGVDIDQLNGMLATTISVTRQAPESVGTAFKTIFARISDIESGLDGETSLGEYTEKMKQLGFDVLDSNNNLRDMGDVIEEIGDKWENLTREQQVSLAQTMAGTRQYNNLLALFENWDMYNAASSTSQKAAGTLEKQNEIALDKIDKKIQQLQASTEELWLTLIDSDFFKGLIDGFTSLVELVTQFTKNLGGAKTVLLAFGAAGSNILSEKFGEFLGKSAKTFAYNKMVKEKNQQTFSEVDTINQSIENKQNYDDANKKVEEFRKEHADIKKELEGQIDASTQQLKIMESQIYSGEVTIDQLNEQQKILTENEESLKALNDQEAQLVEERSKYAEGSKTSKQELETRKQIAIEQEKELSRQKYLTTEEREQRQTRMRAINDAKMQEMQAQEAIVNLNNEKAAAIKAIDEQAKAARDQYLQDLVDAEHEKNQAIIKDYEDTQKKIQDLTKANENIEAEEASVNTTIARQTSLSVDFNTEGDKYTQQAEAARAALSGKQAEYSLHEKAFSTFNKDFNTIDDAKKAQTGLNEELTYIQEHQEELGVSDMFIDSLKEAIDNLAEAIENNDLDAANTASARASGIGKQTFKDAKEENKVAMSYLDKTKGKGNTNKEQKKKNAEELKLQQQLLNEKEKARDKAATQEKKSNEELTKEVEKNSQEQLNTIVESYEEQKQEAIDSYDERIEKEDELGKSAATVRQELEDDQSIENKKLDAKEFGTEVGKLTSGLLSLGAGISMVASLPSIVKDEDLTAGEKIIGILTTAIPAMVSLGSGMSNIISSAPKVIASLSGMSVAELGTASAGKVLKAALEKVKVSMVSLFSTPPLSIIMAIMLGITAAVMIGVAAFEALSAEMKRDAESAKAATEAAENAAKSYASIKAAVDDLKKSLEDYHKAQNAIDDMVVGTEEWKTAIEEANAELTALIDKYPELAKYVKNIDGRLTIVDDEGVKAFEEAMKQAEKSAYINTLQTTVNKNTTQDQADASKFAHDNRGSLSYYRNYGVGIDSDGNEYYYDKGYGDQSSITSVSGQQLNDILSLYQQSENKDMFLSLEHFTSVMEEAGYTNKDMIEALWKNREGLEDLAISMDNHASANDLLTQQIVDTMLEDNIDYTDSADREGINAVMAATYQQMVDDEYEKTWKDGAGKRDKIVQQAYIEMMKETGQWQSGSSKNKGKNKGEYTYVDAAGIKHEADVIDDETVRRALAAYEVQKQMAEDSGQTVKSLQKVFDDVQNRLGDVSEAAQLDLNSFVNGATGSLVNFTEGEFADLKKKLKDGTFTLTDEEAQALGYENAQAYIKAVNNAVEDYKQSEENIIKDLYTAAKAAYEALDLSDFTLQQKKIISDDLNAAFEMAGKEGVAALQNVFSQIDPKDVSKVSSVFNSIKWSSATASNEFLLALEEAGILTDKNKDSFEAFALSMDKVATRSANTAAGFADLREELQKLNKTINSLEIGSVISDEDYKTLLKKNKDLAKYFVMTAEGMMFIGGEGSQDALSEAKTSGNTLAGVKKNYAKINSQAQQLKSRYGGANEQGLYLFTSGRYREILEATGRTDIDKDYIREQMSNLQGDDETKKEAAKEYFDSLYKDINDVIENAELGLYDSINAETTDILQNVHSLSELEEKYANGIYSKEAYDKTKKYFQNKETALLKSIDLTRAETKELENQKKALDELKDGYDLLNKTDKIANLEQQSKQIKKVFDNTKNELEVFKKTQQEILALDFNANFESHLKEGAANAPITNIAELFNQDGTINEAVYQEVAKWLAENVSKLGAENAKWWNDFLNGVNDYSAGIDNRESELRDLVKDQLEANLEKFELKLDIRLETQEIKREFNELKRELTLTDKDIAALTSSYIYDAGTLIKDISILQETLSSVQYAGLSAADAEQKQLELTQQLGEKLLEVKESIDSIIETWETGLDNIQESYDKQVEYLEVINSLFEKQLSLQKLIYGERSANEMKSYYAEVRNNAEQQEILAQQHYENALARYQESISDASKHLFTDEQRERLVDDLSTALNAYSEAIVNSATSIQEEYFNNTSAILADFAKEITGVEDISKLKEDWDWQKQINEGYYDTINASYELKKLDNAFTKAINETTNVKAQERINALRKEELALLQSKDRLSEHEVENAKMQLEILQATIALQDAQDAKTQMRLMRGSDGTYSYQYVADQDKIAEARENLWSLEQDFYNFNQNYVQEKIEQFHTVLAEFITGYQELIEAGASEEELQEYHEKYKSFLEEIAEDAKDARVYLDKAIAKSTKDLQISTENLIVGTADVLNSSITTIVENIAVNGLDETFKQLQKEISKTSQDYYNTLTSKEEALEDLMNNEETGSIALYKNLYTAQANVYDQYKNEYTYITSTLMPAVAGLKNTYNNLKDSINSAYNALIRYKTEQGEKILTSNYPESSGNPNSTVIDPGEGNKEQTDGNKDEAPLPKNPPQKVLRYNTTNLPDTMAAAIQTPDGIYGETLGSIRKTANYTSIPNNILETRLGTIQFNGETYLGIGQATVGSEKYTIYVPKNRLTTLDTGGYTGDWNSSEGRMAMLHEKELVLNKHDTANFLEAVDILRGLNLSMMSTVSGLNVRSMSSAIAHQAAGAPLEQVVQISAEFPNVNSKEEIEAAFSDLVNLAAQHAFKNARG